MKQNSNTRGDIDIHKHLYRRILQTWFIRLQSRSIIPRDENKSSLAASEIYYLRHFRGVASACLKKKKEVHHKQRVSAEKEIASCPFVPWRRTTVVTCALQWLSAKEKRYNDINLTCIRAHCYDNVFKYQPA